MTMRSKIRVRGDSKGPDTDAPISYDGDYT